MGDIIFTVLAVVVCLLVFASKAGKKSVDKKDHSSPASQAVAKSNQIRANRQAMQSAMARSFNSGQPASAGTVNRKVVTPPPSKVASDMASYSMSKRSNSAREKASITLYEDRNNDWMAKQLSEERRALSLSSAMFELKMEHHGSCDAQLLKDFHRFTCDANSVDMAQGH